MSDAQAGTPAVAPENSNAGQGSNGADGSGLNAQQQKEYITLKQKAEEFNKLKAEKDALEAALNVERQVRAQGQATDPRETMIAQLREQAQYDPVAQATLYNMQQSAVANAEIALANALLHVPDAKRDKVAGIVRASSYQTSVELALSMVTDPETKTLHEQLEEAQKTISRLQNTQKNGASPAATVPATADAGETPGMPTKMTFAEYTAALDKGGQAAIDLMKAAAENKVKLVRE